MSLRNRSRAERVGGVSRATTSYNFLFLDIMEKWNEIMMPLS